MLAWQKHESQNRTSSFRFHLSRNYYDELHAEIDTEYFYSAIIQDIQITDTHRTILNIGHGIVEGKKKKKKGRFSEKLNRNR